MAGRTKIVITQGWQGQPQERNPGRICGALAAVVVPGEEKTREQGTMAEGHGSERTRTSPRLRGIEYFPPLLTRADITAHPMQETDVPVSSGVGDLHVRPAFNGGLQLTMASGGKRVLDQSHEVGSSQTSESTHQSTKDRPGTDALTEDLHTLHTSFIAEIFLKMQEDGTNGGSGCVTGHDRRAKDFVNMEWHGNRTVDALNHLMQRSDDFWRKFLEDRNLNSSGSEIERVQRVYDYMISIIPVTEGESSQKTSKKRKLQVTQPAEASKVKKPKRNSMTGKHDFAQGAKAGSNVDDLDLGTKEIGARDKDALKQVLECDENMLTQLLTSYNLATDGSHQQRVNLFYDFWSKTNSDCTKTAPEVQTDGSDNDHKADSANPSFLDALPLSQLSKLLLSRGKSGDGNRRVLEDRLIECYRQEHGLTSGSDHSISDEEALDPSEAGGTSTKRSAEASNICEAKPPLSSGQGRSASTMVFSTESMLIVNNSNGTRYVYVYDVAYGHPSCCCRLTRSCSCCASSRAMRR